LSRERCLEFVQRWLVPANMVVAVLGDVDRDALRHRLERTFGALPARPSPWPDRLPPASLDGVRAASQTMDKEQALIMLGFLGTTHAASDRHALDVLTAALSGMSGRLFQSVREARGLSYTLGAVHVPGWDPGYLLVYAATRPDERARVLDVLEEELRLAAREGFQDEEIDQARRYLIGLHRLDVQHLVGLTKRIALDELYGLGYNAWTTYEARINSITAPMVNEAAKRYLMLDHRTQIIISPDGR
jgi:zinc protease